MWNLSGRTSRKQLGGRDKYLCWTSIISYLHDQSFESYIPCGVHATILTILSSRPKSSKRRSATRCLRDWAAGITEARFLSSQYEKDTKKCRWLKAWFFAKFDSSLSSNTETGHLCAWFVHLIHLQQFQIHLCSKSSGPYCTKKPSARTARGPWKHFFSSEGSTLQLLLGGFFHFFRFSASLRFVWVCLGLSVCRSWF